MSDIELGMGIPPVVTFGVRRVNEEMGVNIDDNTVDKNDVNKGEN